MYKSQELAMEIDARKRQNRDINRTTRENRSKIRTAMRMLNTGKPKATYMAGKYGQPM